MWIAGTEALAGLQLLVAVAKSGSELSRNDERPESPRPGVKRRTASAFFPFAEPRSSGSSPSRLDGARTPNDLLTLQRSPRRRRSPAQ